MRIAQVAPLYESVPPQLYGGTERIVSYLTEELVRIHNLEVAGASVDISFERHEHDVGVNVLRREGDIQIMVIK